MDFNAIVELATRALKAEPSAFTDAGADESHTPSAAVVVAIIGLVSGILTGVFGPGSLVSSVVGGVIGAFIGWFVGTGIFFLLAKLFKGEGDYMSLLRGGAYAAIPSAVSGIPIIGWIVSLYSVWLYIINVRENMSLTTGAAVAVVLIPLAILLFLAIVLIAIIGVALLGAS